MNILTVCLAGCVRSVAMAKALRNEGFTAEAGGVWDIKKAKFLAQLEWADKIVVMDINLLAQIPHRHLRKTTLANVGTDQWGYPGHPELVEKIDKMVATWADAGWSFHPIY